MDFNSPIADKKYQKEILILILCLVVGFALRFYTFDQKSLWGDEVYTFNDSRFNINNQIGFYKEEPTYLHPPLFFILTHLLYPFSKPERDLRIIPLIFGTLSIPMIFFLSRQFSANIALPCTLSLTFMAYHISLSQDGRAYVFLMFLGMGSLFTFMHFLKTSRRIYILLTAFLFAILFFTSYSSIPFLVLFQILFFYQTQESKRKKVFFSFLLLNVTTLLLILPWLFFLGLNYKGQPLTVPYHKEYPGSLMSILYGLIYDWATFPLLLIISVALLILFPFLSNKKRNALILLCMLVFPVGILYLFCRLWGITHFITSRYFINLLPLFLISLYSSVIDIEIKFQKINKWIRPSILLLILFIVSNLLFLPYYYRSEKMDFRRLGTYLKTHLQEGDKIFVVSPALMPGILHYFGNFPKGRQDILYPIAESGGKVGYRSSLFYQNNIYPIFYSTQCCNQYVVDGSRLWIIVFKDLAKDFKTYSPAVLKGYFDGSVLNLHRFPTNASMYLFLWDPKSPEEKGINMPIE